MKKLISFGAISLFSLIFIVLFINETKADWTYTVQRGDTFFTIARRTGVDVNSIKQRTGYWDDALTIGQRLIIPTAAAEAAPAGSVGNIDLLARVVQAEAGGEPYLGKVAVAGVILNRIQDPKFPNTIAGVVYQPHAFESVSNGTIYNPVSGDSRKAAQDAINGWDPSGGALYFFNPAKQVSPWIWTRQIINEIGRHVFAL